MISVAVCTWWIITCNVISKPTHTHTHTHVVWNILKTFPSIDFLKHFKSFITYLKRFNQHNPQAFFFYYWEGISYWLVTMLQPSPIVLIVHECNASNHSKLFAYQMGPCACVFGVSVVVFVISAWLHNSTSNFFQPAWTIVHYVNYTRPRARLFNEKRASAMTENYRLLLEMCVSNISGVVP